MQKMTRYSTLAVGSLAAASFFYATKGEGTKETDSKSVDSANSVATQNATDVSPNPLENAVMFPNAATVVNQPPEDLNPKFQAKEIAFTGVTTELTAVELVDSYHEKLTVKKIPQLVKTDFDMTLVSARLLEYQGAREGLKVVTGAGKTLNLDSWSQDGKILEFKVGVNANQHDLKDPNRGVVTFSPVAGSWSFEAKNINLKEIGIDQEAVITGMYFQFTNSEVELHPKLATIGNPMNPFSEKVDLPLGVAKHPLNNSGTAIYMVVAPNVLNKYEYATIQNGELSLKLGGQQLVAQARDYSISELGSDEIPSEITGMPLDYAWEQIFCLTHNISNEPFIDTFIIGVAFKVLDTIPEESSK